MQHSALGGGGGGSVLPPSHLSFEGPTVTQLIKAARSRNTSGTTWLVSLTYKAQFAAAVIAFCFAF